MKKTITLMLAGFLLFSCGPQENPSSENNAPEISTGQVTEITTTTASCPGNVTSDGGAPVTARGLCWSTTQNPTIADAKTTDGDGTGTFTGHMTGLTSNTTYYVRAYATNSVGTSYGEQRSFKTNQGALGDTFTDARDGKVYKMVTIGEQVWMAENLAYLPAVAGPETGSITTPYYYVHGYNGTDVNAAKATANYNTYGVLYNWAAAMAGASSSNANPSGVQAICPAGWHLPSHAEWTQLTDYLGGLSVAGGKMKEAGLDHWKEPNTGATNLSGFTALPGGCRNHLGTFSPMNDPAISANYGYWWSSTASEYANYSWYRVLSSDNANVHNGSSDNYGIAVGYSVRCVRD